MVKMNVMDLLVLLVNRVLLAHLVTLDHQESVIVSMRTEFQASKNHFSRTFSLKNKNTLKGPPGTSGPAGRDGKDGAPGENGVCIQECSPQQQIAFFAGLSENFNARGETIIFDTVVTNQCFGCEGEAAQGAYDEETGKFIAPIDGTYFFHVNVL